MSAFGHQLASRPPASSRSATTSPTRAGLCDTVPSGSLPVRRSFYGGLADAQDGSGFIDGNSAGGTALAVIESGTNRADNLVGTGDADDPYGSGEEIHGGAGDDTIFGSGDLFGDGGNDSLRAAQGEPDTVSCGAGRDRVYADPALDTVADDCEDARPAR